VEGGVNFIKYLKGGASYKSLEISGQRLLRQSIIIVSSKTIVNFNANVIRIIKTTRMNWERDVGWDEKSL
jgi:hypothetical protein